MWMREQLTKKMVNFFTLGPKIGISGKKVCTNGKVKSIWRTSFVLTNHSDAKTTRTNMCFPEFGFSQNLTSFLFRLHKRFYADASDLKKSSK